MLKKHSVTENYSDLSLPEWNVLVISYLLQVLNLQSGLQKLFSITRTIFFTQKVRTILETIYQFCLHPSDARTQRILWMISANLQKFQIKRFSWEASNWKGNLKKNLKKKFNNQYCIILYNLSKGLMKRMV